MSTPNADTSAEAMEVTATSTDSSESELLGQKIGTLGEEIKTMKSAGDDKSLWEPILQEMLKLKIQYKQMTGNDYGPSSSSAKKEAKGDGQQEATEKNREKNEAKAKAKAEKEAKKQQAREERERREREKADKVAALATTGDGVAVGADVTMEAVDTVSSSTTTTSTTLNFGTVPLIQSEKITNRVWTDVSTLEPKLAGQSVLLRGYLQTSRLVGKGVFVLIRSSLYSVQGVCFETNAKRVQSDPTVVISSSMIKYISATPLESVIDIMGIVTVPEIPIDSATQKLVEIQIQNFYCISKVSRSLPFRMEDACRPDTVKESDVGEYNEDDEVVATTSTTNNNTDDDAINITVGQKMRLDYRWLDLRTPANQSIFRIESMVGTLFREYLLSKNFIEIHTPKLIGGASEGGSDVFTLNYFGQPACLAMSPQLHKQMASACSGFERVYECGPVFRAENSNTRRHLCEFTGFDLEMTIHEHYDEVLHVLSELFVYIFDGLKERCSAEIERVREQHPFEDLQYLRPTLRLTYAEGCELLRTEGNINQNDYDDLSTENEKKLGDIVKAKYNTDFYFLDKFPSSVRPFYTMPDPHNDKLSNSYDFFIRGQEILSGAQRIHDADILQEKATNYGIDIKDIEAYINSFRHGAMPHGGGGIGLERVVMLYLGLPNIRKSAWFPRDPKRLTP